MLLLTATTLFKFHASERFQPVVSQSMNNTKWFVAHRTKENCASSNNLKTLLQVQSTHIVFSPIARVCRQMIQKIGRGAIWCADVKVKVILRLDAFLVTLLSKIFIFFVTHNESGHTAYAYVSIFIRLL